MNIPGLLIEYLIIGGVSCLWLLPLLLWLGVFPTSESDVLKAIAPVIAVPFLYVMGLMIDIPTEKLIERRKDSIRKKMRKEFYDKFKCSKSIIADKIDFATVEVMYLSQDLGKESEMRSSRDRIARGTFLNLFIAAFVFPPLSESPLCSRHDIVVFFVLLGLSGVFYLIWERCETASYWYRLRAIYILITSPKPSK
jgi:hypothetical protein